MTSHPSTSPDPRTRYHGTVIAIVGPSHSGKSVFLAELYRQLLHRDPTGVFLHRACPDGEGMWSNEADPEIVQLIRKKCAFSEEFVTVTLRSIERLGRNPHHRIVLLDLGGKRTAENAEILRRSTHCIILSSQIEAISAWQTFVISEECEILAVFRSQLIYNSSQGSQTNLDLIARSTLQTDTTPMTGTLVNLCRSQSADCYSDAISTLAEALLVRLG